MGQSNNPPHGLYSKRPLTLSLSISCGAPSDDLRLMVGRLREEKHIVRIRVIRVSQLTYHVSQRLRARGIHDASDLALPVTGVIAFKYINVALAPTRYLYIIHGVENVKCHAGGSWELKRQDETTLDQPQAATNAPVGGLVGEVGFLGECLANQPTRIDNSLHSFATSSLHLSGSQLSKYDST